jgi:ankyrin repeat protein
MKIQQYVGLVFFRVALSSFAMEEDHLPAYLRLSIPSDEKLYRAILNDAPAEIEAVAKSSIADSRCYISRGSKSMPPLWWALSLVKPKAVQALLALGVNPNMEWANIYLSTPKATVQVNSRGAQTIISRAESTIKPVHYAALNGDMESTLALIQADADVSGDIFSTEAHTAKPVKRDIMGCALKYYVEDEETAYQVITALFAKKGYRIANNHRYTNIWFAAIYNPIGRYPLNRRLLNLLIEQKADVNDHFDYGAVRVTPLGYAIQAGAVNAVALLLEAGARVDREIKRKNEPSRMLLEFARERVRDQRPNAGGILQLLQEHEAKK